MPDWDLEESCWTRVDTPDNLGLGWHVSDVGDEFGLLQNKNENPKWTFDLFRPEWNFRMGIERDLATLEFGRGKKTKVVETVLEPRHGRGR